MDHTTYRECCELIKWGRGSEAIIILDGESEGLTGFVDQLSNDTDVDCDEKVEILKSIISLIL